MTATRKITPPTTPPAIAPTFGVPGVEESELEGLAGDEIVGMNLIAVLDVAV